MILTFFFEIWQVNAVQEYIRFRRTFVLPVTVMVICVDSEFWFMQT